MFDPYYKWLGIPREEQPPNHYRLLGLSLFESDPDVIDSAANRQMAYIQGCATGPHAFLSQRLLNDLAAARLCLLDPEKKASYDARMKAKRSVAKKTPVATEPFPEQDHHPEVRRKPLDEPVSDHETIDGEAGPNDVTPALAISSRPQRYAGKKRKTLPLVPSIVVLLAAGLAIASVLLNTLSGVSRNTKNRLVDKNQEAIRQALGAKKKIPSPTVVHEVVKQGEPTKTDPSAEVKNAPDVVREGGKQGDPSEARSTADAASDSRNAPSVVREGGKWVEPPNTGSTSTRWDKNSPVGEVFRFTGHEGTVTFASFTRDGKLAISGGDDGTVRVWDGSKEVRRFDTGTQVQCMAFSRDEHLLATGVSKGDIILWDFASGTKLRTLKGHSFSTVGLAFFRDGKTLISSSGHSGDPTTRLWNVRWGSQVGQISSCGPIAISPAGTSVLIGEFKTPTLRNLPQLSPICRFEGHQSLIHSVAFSPDGKTVVSGSGWDIDGQGFFAGSDNTVRLWSVSTGKEKRRFVGHENFVYSVAISPDGKRILSGGGGNIEGHNNWNSGTDMSLRLWDVRSGREIQRFLGHNQPIKSVAFSPDGMFAISGSEDRTARIWRLPKPQGSD